MRDRAGLVDGVLFICGTRLTLMLQRFERDQGGRLVHLLAALDAHSCATIAEKVQERQPRYRGIQVTLNRVSLEATQALLTQALILADPSSDEALEVEEMQELLEAILAGVRRLTGARRRG